MMQKSLVLMIRILLGGTFLLSAYLKLYPIEPFELNFINLGVANWITAPFIARALIGLEFFLGSMLLFGLLLRKFTLPAVFGLLLFFSLYLILELILQGDQGNCGCFGTYLQMTPLQSLAKNFLLAALAIVLYKLCTVKTVRWQKTIITLIAVACFALPFILNPVDLLAGKIRQPETVDFRFPMEMVTGEHSKHDSIDLMKGKHIIGILSLNCPHCKVAAFKMHVIKKRLPEAPFYFILNGKPEELPAFYDATETQDIPYLFLHAKDFYALTGGSWPQIYWLDDGTVVKKSLYISLNEAEIAAWMNEK